MKKFNDCDIQWDVYRLSYNHRELIQSINPPLSDQEFEAELLSSKKIKKYYYTYDKDNES